MKKKNVSGKAPIILLIIAAICLVASTVGSANAALTFHSEHYSAEVVLDSIGVTLVENGEGVSYRDYIKDDTWHEATGVLLENMLEKDEELILGKVYKEEISVKNSGEIDSYVRVILTKSWRDSEGKKDPTLSPDLIDLHLLPGEDWIIDEESSTPERTILYYTKILDIRLLLFKSKRLYNKSFMHKKYPFILRQRSLIFRRKRTAGDNDNVWSEIR